MGTIRLYSPLRLNGIKDRATQAALRQVDDFLRSLFDSTPDLQSSIDALDARIDTLEARDLVTHVVKSADQAVTAVGFGSAVDVADLSFSVEAGKTYSFVFEVLLTTDAPTTGPRLAINGPAASLIAYVYQYDSGTGFSTNTLQSAYDSGPATTSGPGTAGGAARVYGSITPTASGTLTLRANTETGTTTIKAGSFGMLYQTA